MLWIYVLLFLGISFYFIDPKIGENITLFEFELLKGSYINVSQVKYELNNTKQMRDLKLRQHFLLCFILSSCTRLLICSSTSGCSFGPNIFAILYDFVSVTQPVNQTWMRIFNNVIAFISDSMFCPFIAVL